MDQAPSPLPKGSSARPRSTLPILFGVVVMDLIGFGIVMPILPFYAKDFHVGGSVLGLLLASYAAMQFLCAPLWGRLSDRIGRRPVMLATMTGAGLALLGVGLSTSLVPLFAARILGGAFAGNISVATAYVTDVTDDSERTRWMGMVGASYGVGFLLGPAIAFGLVGYGNNVPVLVAAGLGLVNLLFAATSLREPQVHRGEVASATLRAQVLADPRVRILGLTNLFFALAVTQLESMFAFFLMDRFGADEHEVLLIMVGMAVVMAGIQGGGMRALAARFGERRLLLGGGAALAVAFALLPAAPSEALLMAPLALAAVGRAVAQPAMMGLVSFASTPATRGVVMGTFQSRASLARVFGPFAAGVLYDMAQGGPFVLAAVLMLLALVVATRLPPSPVLSASQDPSPAA